MISKDTLGLDNIQSEHMQKNIELQSEDCESYEQPREETSFHGSGGFGLAVKEDIIDG